MMTKHKALSMTITSKTLSDRFTLETYDDAAIDQAFTVTIKNLSYRLKALNYRVVII